MGIKGLGTFLRPYQSKHQLYNTELVIDGDNLQYNLYDRFLRQQNYSNYKLFGGDYTRLALFYRSFFEKLLNCSITPILIFDGSVDLTEQAPRKIRERFDQRLNNAYRAYHGESLPGETLSSFNSVHNHDVFVQVLDSMGITHCTAISEADSIIPLMAYHLQCPVLSQDNEHYLYNLPNGVIHLNSLNFLFSESCKRYYFLRCKIFKLKTIKEKEEKKFGCQNIQKYPGIELELVPLIKAIIGNHKVKETDLELFCETVCDSLGIPYEIGANQEDRLKSKFHAIFTWLSMCKSYDDIERSLRAILGEEHEALENLEEERNKMIFRLQFDFGNRKMTFKEFHYILRDELFIPEEHIPQWVHDQYMDGRFNKRLMTIFHARYDLFRPLMDDFSLVDSSFECIFDMNRYIYAILRDNDDTSPVTVYVRKREKALIETIAPLYEVNGQPLPVLSDIESLSDQDRRSLFFNILDMDPNLVEEIKDLFRSLETLDSDKQNQFVTFVLAFIYMCRKVSEQLWIEFCYALLVNLMLMGHTCKDLLNTSIRSQRCLPKWLELDRTNSVHMQFQKKLLEYDKIPIDLFDSLDKKANNPYKARIVHFYNAFQNCLNNICFLAQILYISDEFAVDEAIIGLQGTFIYNLTVELGKQEKPLLYLEHELIGSDFNSKFQNLVDFVMGKSNRQYLLETDEANNNIDRTIVPEHVIQQNNCAEQNPINAFIQGMKEVKKKKDIFVQLDEINLDDILPKET